jgi:hypothetical protein
MIFAGAMEFVHLSNSSSVQAGGETGALMGLPVYNDDYPWTKTKLKN